MNDDELRDVFDRMASGYDSKMARMAPVYDGLYFLLESVLAELPQDARILCIGVGTGAELIHLAGVFPRWRFTAVEPSRAMLDICREQVDAAGLSSRCTLHEGYLESLPAEELHDAATCLLVSQFILDDHARSDFFRQIAGRLVPGGILVNADLSANVESEDYDALLAIWQRVMATSPASAEELERMKSGYAKDVAILPPAATGSIIESGGFDRPVQFFQAALMSAWFAKRTAQGPFYHGTKAGLKPGDLIRPGYRSNYDHLGERTSPWVYMTATLSPLGAELARGDGPGRLYIVEPTGPFVDDPDLTDKRFPGNPTKSYRSRHPLRVVGEVTDWKPSPPEQIQAIMEAQDRLYAVQAERVARIPSAVEFGRIHARTDELAHEWTPQPEYVGCMLLMLIRGTDVGVCSAAWYRSEALAETRLFELPCPIDAQPSWPQRDESLSGRITAVSAWHEGWVAAIESCVTEIGLSTETRMWIAVDADRDTLRFRVDADGPERSWQRNLLLAGGVLTDTEHGEIWDFGTGPVGG